MKLNFLKTWSKQDPTEFKELICIDSPFSYKVAKWGVLHDLTSISFQCSFGLKNKIIQQKINLQRQNTIRITVQ